MPTIRNLAKGIFGKRPAWFERYTENARRTIYFGRWEALQVDSGEIEPRHIVLGLFRDAWFTNEVLKGVPVDELRRQIIASLPSPQDEPKQVDLPLSAESKRVLAHAGTE